MIPPRGCAYIVMMHREDAYRALQKLGRGLYKVNQKAIKVCNYVMLSNDMLKSVWKQIETIFWLFNFIWFLNRLRGL